MRFLLDTNVISETARPRPSTRVFEWIRSLPTLPIPVIAVYEIASGIRRLPHGRKRDFLEAWFAELLGAGADVLSLDQAAALASADLEATARSRRRTLEHRDLLILGIASSRSLGVATRNVVHYRGLGVPVYDPFEDAHYL